MSKLSKKAGVILAIALLAVAVISFILAGTAIVFNSGINPTDARNSVVLIFAAVSDAEGNSLANTGTGWAVGRPGQPVEYIVTNGHVVENAHIYPKTEPRNYKGTIQVFFSMAENDYVSPQVVYYSGPSEKDIAILKLPSPTDKRVPLSLRDSDEMDSGDQVYALGFPGSSDYAQRDIRYDVKDVTVTSGIISKRVHTVGTEYEAFQIDASINRGNSGGPLVDNRGFCVGVNTAGMMIDVGGGDTLERGINYSSISNQLIRILNEEGIPYSIRGEKNWMLFVFLPLGVLALAAAVIVAMQTRKKAAPQAAETGSVAAATPQDKKPVNGAPLLRGISGKYAGEKFDMTGKKITIGRDAQKCNLVYGADVAGVSAVHCTLYYDTGKGVFYLEDLGSTYGTFLGNDSKVSPNVPVRLNPGDSFYLANASNKFIVGLE